MSSSNPRYSIKNTLNSYVKQKNYSIHERFRKSDLVLTQSKKDFLMDLKIKNEISRTNSFTYSNISSLNSASSPVDQQVSKLVKFIQCQRNLVVRRELESLLPPLICHLFIEMLKGKEWRPAHEFLQKYSALIGIVQDSTPVRVNGNDSSSIGPHPIVFMPQQTKVSHQNAYHPTESPSSTTTTTCSSIKHQQPQLSQLNIDEQKLVSFKELIRNLSYLKRLEDIGENSLPIVKFRSCKYKAHLANKSLNVLNKYLSKHGHVLIIQVFHVWFSMDLYELKHDESSSSSSSDCTIVEGFDYMGNEALNHNNNRTTSSDRFNEQSQCDIRKDIKFSLNSRLLHLRDYGVPIAASEVPASLFDNDNDDVCGSNMKLKRLRECLHRVDNKYHKPIRIFNINYTENSLCTASMDKRLCHLAAGFEDSTIVLWSLNGNENYGRKPFQTFDDRLCQWSINNCNRILTDDLSDYETSDEEIEQCLKEACGEEETNDKSSIHSPLAGRKKLGNKYRRTASVRQQWQDFSAKSCSENYFSIDSQNIVLRGHRGAVTDVMFGRKEDILLSVSRDKTFRLWKADSYTCASVYRGHEYPIWCIDESSNGCYAATGSRDTTARLWSFERKFPVKVYVGHTQDVDCIAFHPNGNYLATGSTDTTIRMWCVTSGKLLRIFTECHFPVNTISFSPDGKMLAAGGDELKVRIFDLAAGQQLMDLRNHTASVKSLCWSSDSKKLLSGCSDGSFYVWNINNLGLSSSNTSTNSKDSKPSASSSGPSTSKHSSSSTTGESSRASSSSVLQTNSGTSSTSSSTLIQSNSTGCKRIVKVFFHGPDELVHALGND